VYSQYRLEPSHQGISPPGTNLGPDLDFDFDNQKEVWRYQAGGEIKSTAAVVDDTVYFTAWDHQLHAIEIENRGTPY
jgi:outer membrane protein assembly factor BamB